ncbi:hypothetical protein BpHYR1_039286 [Brachionus plicatilis]|uniref:Uncharacterized protein n=1 Tax=Brachionus plicatilis TaxID=10195 RepID=A0A3M7PTR7_BRAPC|nr:hypothetical protein BpHYR1_039286 [Brachionus plicatilis]
MYFQHWIHFSLSMHFIIGLYLYLAFKKNSDIWQIYCIRQPKSSSRLGELWFCELLNVKQVTNFQYFFQISKLKLNSFFIHLRVKNVQQSIFV